MLPPLNHIWLALVYFTIPLPVLSLLQSYFIVLGLILYQVQWFEEFLLQGLLSFLKKTFHSFLSHQHRPPLLAHWSFLSKYLFDRRGSPSLEELEFDFWANVTPLFVFFFSPEKSWLASNWVLNPMERTLPVIFLVFKDYHLSQSRVVW